MVQRFVMHCLQGLTVGRAACRGIAHRMLEVAPAEPQAHLLAATYSSNELQRATWTKRGVETAVTLGSDWHIILISTTGAQHAAILYEEADAFSGAGHSWPPSKAELRAEVQRLLKLARASLRRIRTLLPTGSVDSLKLIVRQVSGAGLPCALITVPLILQAPPLWLAIGRNPHGHGG